MNTEAFIETLEQAKAIRKRAQERRRRNAELRQFLLGGSLVMTGWLLAVMCQLVSA